MADIVSCTWYPSCPLTKGWPSVAFTAWMNPPHKGRLMAVGSRASLMSEYCTRVRCDSPEKANQMMM
jgi:hypothetical protein